MEYERGFIASEPEISTEAHCITSGQKSDVWNISTRGEAGLNLVMFFFTF